MTTDDRAKERKKLGWRLEKAMQNFSDHLRVDLARPFPKTKEALLAGKDERDDAKEKLTKAVEKALDLLDEVDLRALAYLINAMIERDERIEDEIYGNS
jgi:hypothetical protein